ncbi:MAG: HlyD family secretion protein [Flavisolibacter sp.]
MKKIIIPLSLTFVILSCGNKKEEFDASGSFEADEVVVSSELGGQILQLNVNEGDSLSQGQVVGMIDSTNLALQKEQVKATIRSLSEKTNNVQPQVELLQNQLLVQQSQLKNLLHEKDRTERLVKADAATGKQLDDINSQIDVLHRQMQVTEQQIAVQKNNTSTQNRSILSETAPLEKQEAQVQERISKSRIVNPINGTVITKYAEQGEITSPGKALYEIADLSFLNLKAYVTGAQLSQIKLGQQVKVLVDNGANDYRSYTGTITWISDKAEFTPKTIQTKEERANLVYAVKIKVKNDGYLKLGMYGEVQLETRK